MSPSDGWAFPAGLCHRLLPAHRGPAPPTTATLRRRWAGVHRPWGAHQIPPPRPLPKSPGASSVCTKLNPRGEGLAASHTEGPLLLPDQPGVTLGRPGAYFSPPNRLFSDAFLQNEGGSCSLPLSARSFATAVCTASPPASTRRPAPCPRCMCKVFGGGRRTSIAGRGLRCPPGCGAAARPRRDSPAQGAVPPPPMRLLFRSIRLRLIKNNRSLTPALLPPGWCVVNGDIVSLDPRLLFCLSVP